MLFFINSLAFSPPNSDHFTLLARIVFCARWMLIFCNLSWILPCNLPWQFEKKLAAHRKCDRSIVGISRLSVHFHSSIVIREAIWSLDLFVNYRFRCRYMSTQDSTHSSCPNYLKRVQHRCDLKLTMIHHQIVFLFIYQ